MLSSAPMTLAPATFEYAPSVVSEMSVAPDRVIVSAVMASSDSAERFISPAMMLATPTTSSVLAPSTLTVRVPCFSTCTGCSSVHDEA